MLKSRKRSKRKPPGSAGRAAKPRNERLAVVLELSSDGYWAQDENHRFTAFEGSLSKTTGIETQHALGKTLWDLGAVPVGDNGDWHTHRATLAAKKNFDDFLCRYVNPNGEARLLSFSGRPVLDARRRFQGYRGIGRDVTAQRQQDEEVQRFRAAMDASPDMIHVTDRESLKFLWANETAVRVSGYSREELLKMGPLNILRVERSELERSYDDVVAAGTAGTVTEVKARTKDGTRTVIESRRTALRLNGRWIIVTISQDISPRKRAEQATLRISRMFAALSATNEAIMRVTSAEELYQRVCDAAVNGGKYLTAAILIPDAETGWTRIKAVTGAAQERLRAARISVDEANLEGRGLAGLAFRSQKPSVSNDFLKDERTQPWHSMAREMGIASAAAVPLIRAGRTIGVLLFYSSEKHVFDAEIVMLLEHMAENLVFALDNLEHEAERMRGQERIQYLATHDGLTGLPNRVMFSELLNLAIESARRYERKFAVLFIDLDRFKIVNDTLGHDAGDLLLREMSSRLKECMRASDVVARLGGDEFVMLVQEVNDAEQVGTVARKILSAVIKPIELMQQECRVTASIGVSMYPGDAGDEQSLMKNADMAMYLAKEEGKNNFQFYTKDIKSQSIERLTLETNLRHAMERNEFSLHYQAKLDLKTRIITGVEALLRWQHPTLGMVSPAQFIPLAEETGLIVPIGKWVLRTACAQNVAWQREGLPEVCIAVNLSPRQFADTDLQADIAAALHDSGMKPTLLELEITESMVMHDTERAVKLLTAISQLGVRLAIDDFGTGYSSLAQIKRFPIDTLKVDRSFIRDLSRNSEDRAITEAIIAMGKTLSLTVVAEGVETKEQEAFLLEHACDETQGYYFSKPVIPEQFADLLRSHVPVATSIGAD